MKIGITYSLFNKNFKWNFTLHFQINILAAIKLIHTQTSKDKSWLNLVMHSVSFISNSSSVNIAKHLNT